MNREVGPLPYDILQNEVKVSWGHPNCPKSAALNRFSLSTFTRWPAITAPEWVTESPHVHNLIIIPGTLANGSHEANLHSQQQLSFIQNQCSTEMQCHWFHFYLKANLDLDFIQMLVIPQCRRFTNNDCLRHFQEGQIYKRWYNYSMG